jgi:alpha-methylacyl-CoA racemase
LAGTVVIELAGKGPSQFGAMILADLGADVVRVDRLTDLDRPLASYDPTLDILNRGRRSVAVDLGTPEGARIFGKLASKADAVIDPFRPGVAERLGIGPEDLMESNPLLVYARMTGWGGDGPYARVAGHDINFLASNGVLDLIGRIDTGPVPPLNLVGDFGGGGMLLAVSVLAAITAARRDGAGQVVDVSMLEASALLATVVHTLRAMGQWGPRGTNLLDTGAPFYDVYRTADGGYVSFGAMEGSFYRNALEVLGLGDDDVVTGAHLDPSLWPAARERLADAFSARTREEWEQAFAGIDSCVEPVLTLDEAMGHPQVEARGVYISVDGVVQPAPAPQFSRTPVRLDRPPPAPGDHTREVLAGVGVDDAELERLVDLGIVRG